MLSRAVGAAKVAVFDSLQVLLDFLLHETTVVDVMVKAGTNDALLGHRTSRAPMAKSSASVADGEFGFLGLEMSPGDDRAAKRF